VSSKIKLKRQLTAAGQTKAKSKAPKNLKGFLAIPGILILLFIGFLYLGQDSGQSASNIDSYVELESDLKITKNEITSDAKFYPFKIDGVNMEVIALKANDGTIRTALNTCQVCYSSGRGYYIQEPNTKKLVCQNCGNKFTPENVEVIRGGCNPIPISDEAKTDDGTNITIARSFLEESKYWFAGWSKS